MQRLLLFLLVLIVFTLNGCAVTPERGAVTSSAKPAAVVRAAAQAPVAQTFPLESGNGGGLVQRGIPRSAQVALLLPLKSADFSSAADAVQRGVLAASNLQTGVPKLTVKVYPTSDQTGDILSAYRQAVQDGNQAIIGPLTRNAVTALVRSGLATEPTLTLNVPGRDDHVVLPPRFYLFSLSVEDEARQMAQHAFAEGRRSVIILTANTPLAKRIQQAFFDEWNRLGGTVVAQVNFSTDLADLSTLHDNLGDYPADMIFIATGARRARLVRPYLGNTLPLYATSMVYGSRRTLKNIDLSGVHFLDMPWLLQPDNAAVMTYPRLGGSVSLERQRFYALGIDAFRLINLMMHGTPPGAIDLDGVTGRIKLVGAHHFIRQLLPAVFDQGRVKVDDSAGP